MKAKKIKPPWAFDPKNADQRAAPSAAAGTYWGMGVKNPMGKPRDVFTMDGSALPKKRLTKPPKSLA